MSFSTHVLNLTTPYQLASLSNFFSLRGFSDHWINHLFQSNQRFQAIEFVDWPILGDLRAVSRVGSILGDPGAVSRSIKCPWWKFTRGHFIDPTNCPWVSEDGLGEKAGRKFSSKGGRAPGYRLTRKSNKQLSLTRQNNFARASRFFVHFFAVNCTTTRENA